MKGINLAEQCHVFVPLSPTDISGGRTSLTFSMENYAHASLIVAIGASASAFTSIVVNECTSSAGAGATPIAFNSYKQEATVSGDVLGARVAVAAAGITPAAVDGIFYVIEIDASALSDGSNWIQVVCANGVNSVIAAIVGVLSGSRYAGAQSPTVTS